MQLYCRTYSPGRQEEEGQPPIIFLHGLGLSGRNFKNVAPVICQKTKRKVIKFHCFTRGIEIVKNEIFDCTYFKECLVNGFIKRFVIFLYGIIMPNFQAFVPDFRNHGNSPWIKEMNYAALTKDLLELMQQNGIETAVLVGNSMGGRVAINFALKYVSHLKIYVCELH